MKTIIIILGLTAGQIQDRSTANLDVASLYDNDARHFQGPIAVRYQIKDAVIDLPESELVSLSFRMGILTSANVTPQRRPLNGAETAKLCQELEETFLHQGFTVPEAEGKEFKKFTEGLKLGLEAAEPLPPWRFGWDMGRESVNIVIRPFESSSTGSSNSGEKRYTIMLGFGNSAVSDRVYKSMKATKEKYFPNRRGQIPMSEYPK
jgi:hypothetical protein